MSDYDFKTLSDKEFEIFCADILSESLGHRIERFKPGRDSGVDGRYFSSPSKEVIIQCKHWANTPIENLIRRLGTDEFPKLARLKPSRYIVAVSNSLSRADKQKIKKILSPYIKSESDIYGREDLNDLLSKNPSIERRHYKLWLSSANVLTHILNKPIFERSSFTIDEILADTKRYAHTSNHAAAIEKLEQMGIVIITGEAGVGKTTLANHICLHYVSNGFELLKIGDEIHEAEEVFDADELQLFYFDDFLGRNYLEALSGHEGNHIVQFIRRIGRDKKKRFVLTSRTTILNQGKVLIDTFKHQNLERNEFELRVDSLSELDKAKILYNHIWHSNLSPDYIEEIYKEKRYKDIIRHQNFNPRLIAFITDAERLSNCTPATYWRHITLSLNNPADVWENPFDAQLDDYGRAMVLLVTLNSRGLSQSELAEAYARYLSHSESSGMQGKRDFLLTLRHLTGSMLSRFTQADSSGTPFVNLFNPSIGDFVLRRYCADIPALKLGFASLRSAPSLTALSDIHKNKLVSHEDVLRIATSLAELAVRREFVGYSIGYVAELGLLLTELGKGRAPVKELVATCANHVKSEPCPFSVSAPVRLVTIGVKQGCISEDDAELYVESACKQTPYFSELESISELIKSIESTFDVESQHWDDFARATTEHFKDNVDELAELGDVFESVEPTDLSDAQTNLANIINARLDELGLNDSQVDIDEIVDQYDIETKAEEYFRSDDDDSHDYRERSNFQSQHIDEIDDLFDRT